MDIGYPARSRLRKERLFAFVDAADGPETRAVDKARGAGSFVAEFIRDGDLTIRKNSVPTRPSG